MTLLAIDTSSAYASVALFDGSAVVAEETWHARRRHDDELFPAIERLLALGGIAAADITRIAVAVGPGSFTGVRVGIAAAQGIARASGAALAGVGTLDAIALPFAGVADRVCALVGAGRDEHYAAMYRRRRAAWTRTSPVLVGSLVDIARTVRIDTLFAGDLASAADELRRLLGDRALLPPVSARVRRAGAVAELGWARIEAGGRIDPAALEPLYIRPPTIRRGGEIVDEGQLAPLASALRPRG